MGSSSAPLVDVSVFERKPEDAYGNTKADQTDTYADTKADQTGLADTKADQTDGSYSEDSSAVKITQTYTDDNSDLISKDTDGYSQDTSADIVKEKVNESPY